MPGIIGLISKSDRNDIFKKIISWLNHFNYDIQYGSRDDVHLARLHHNYINTLQQPVFSKDQRYSIIMIGEIFHDSISNTKNEIDDSRFLLNLYIDKGFKGLININGHFSAAIYDFYKRELILISDRFGTRPLYYLKNNSEFAFSSEVKSLIQLCDKKSPNFDSISELFHFGHLFGYKTMFDRIYQLPPASVLVFSEDKIEITRYWDYPYYEAAYSFKEPSNREIESYEDEMVALITQAVKRQTLKNSSSILFSLSGGLDSRWIIAMAHHLDVYPITAFTMGEHNTEDVIYAKRVAEFLKADHSSFQVKPEDIWGNAKTFSYISDSMSIIYGPISGFNPLKYYYKKKEIIISSQMCDAVFGSTLGNKRIKALLARSVWDERTISIFQNLFNLVGDEDLKLVFNKDYYEQFKDNYLVNYNHYIDKSIHPMFAYYKILMNEHGRRGTLGGNILNNLFFETRMPSYDNDLMDFAFRLPLSFKKNQYIYRKAFNKIFPELAAIPREGTNLPLTAPDYRINLKKLELRIVKKLKSTPLNSTIQKFNRWNRPAYVNYKSLMKKELKNNVENLLFDDRTLLRGHINSSGLRQLMNKHYYTETDYSRLIWQLINLEYFYRHFID